MNLFALFIKLGLARAMPVIVDDDGDNISLTVLSHDNFISETNCSWSSEDGRDQTKFCLHAVIKDLTPDFLTAYQEVSRFGSTPDDRRSSIRRAVGLRAPHYQSAEASEAKTIDLTRDIQQRDAEAGAGGFVGNFYWLSLSSEAHDHFNKSPANVELIATTLSDYVLEYNATEICVDFSTNKGTGGIIANGVMTFGWGLEPFYYADPTLLERRLKQDCQIGNMLMYATHYREVDLI